MARVVFTPNLRKHVACPSHDVSADTVRTALDAVFDESPKLRSYILNEQGQLRRHVTIFVDNQLISDRVQLTDSLGPTSEMYVMQALSGG